MQPHLICLDLDGTLLNDNKEISSYTKQVLNELQQRGHQLLILMALTYITLKIKTSKLAMKF